MRDFLTLGESSLVELSSFCHFDVTEDGLQADLPLFPSSRVWPMGYSWSSAVAQDVSLGLLRCGGFSEDQVICVEEPVPANQEECLFVLTDDCIMAHIKRASRRKSGFTVDEGRARVVCLDFAMAANGVQRKEEKDNVR